MLDKMEMGIGITIFLSCLSVAQSQTIVDVTTLDGNPGSDITQALATAWDTACAATTSTRIVIPKGTFTLKEANLTGPCKAPVEIQVDGTIQGPSDPTMITRDTEWIDVKHVQNFTLFGKGIFDGQGGAKAWLQSDRCASVSSCSKLADNFAFNFVDNAVVSNITSKNSKLFHMLVFGCNNFTISNVTIDAPAESPNTDGIHIGRSNRVTVENVIIKTGDDCVSLGDGSKQVNITGVTCGPGHGISIGSLGMYSNEEPVEGVFVSNCTLVGTDNGVRIKTWAGAAAYPLTADDIHFENIRLEHVSNPIFIDQLYCPLPPCKIDPPSKVQISKVSFKGITGTSATPEVVKLICSKRLPCQGVEIGEINLSYEGPRGPATTNCTNVQPKFVGDQTPAVCR